MAGVMSFLGRVLTIHSCLSTSFTVMRRSGSSTMSLLMRSLADCDTLSQYGESNTNAPFLIFLYNSAWFSSWKGG